MSVTDSDSDTSSVSSLSDHEDPFVNALSSLQEPEMMVDDNCSMEPPKTKNEQCPFSEQDYDSIEVPPNPSFSCLGETYSFVERTLVVQANPNTPLASISIGSVAVFQVSSEQLIILGRIYDIFGPLDKPYYSIHVPLKVETSTWTLPHSPINVLTSSLSDPISLVSLQQESRVATDASGTHDEPSMEPSFSDDEEEQRYKQSLKRRNGGENQHVKKEAHQSNLIDQSNDNWGASDFYVIPSRPKN
ncbi:hypothetical protein RCL1_002024 [Eukaryota sp. TZLM3-RCL]